MAFRLKKPAKKKRSAKAALLLRLILNKIRKRLEQEVRAKLRAKAEKMDLSLSEEELNSMVEKEVNALLEREKEKISASPEDVPDEVMEKLMKKLEGRLMEKLPAVAQKQQQGGELEEAMERLKAKLLDVLVDSISRKVQEQGRDVDPAALQTYLTSKISGLLDEEVGAVREAAEKVLRDPSAMDEAMGAVIARIENRMDEIMEPIIRNKIGAPVRQGYAGSRYTVPFGFVAPLFKDMSGPQIIEKVQELYHVPFQRGEEKKKKVRETYALIPENPKPGEKVFAWAYIHWDPKSKELVYEVIEPPLSEREKEMIRRLEERIEDKLDTIYLSSKNMNHEAYLREKIREVVGLFGWKLDRETSQKIEYYIFRDFMGFEKIEPLMHDKNIEDISCDGVNIPVYIFHRNPDYGQMRTNIYFTSKEELDSFVIKLAQKAGKSISVARPLLDASLPDGSRLQATLGSDIARRGSNFTIRKFLREPLTPTKLMEFGTANSTTLAYLWFCIEYGKSILVAGATATGKTSFLNAIALFMRPELKVVSIEDTAELMLPLPNWIPQVARPGYGAKSYGAVEMFDLLKAALRQRPDYVIVGEVRGKEASTMFQGMATGHPSLATIHADTLQRLVDRLTTPPINLSAALLENLDVVVFLVRTKAEGRFVRRVNKVYEVAGVNVREKKIIPNKLFEWDPVKDEINLTGKSMVLKKIAEFKGIDYETVFKELQRRALFLEWLSMNRVTDYLEFEKWVQSYYYDTNKVMNMVINDVRKRFQKGDKMVSEKLRALGE